MRASIEERHQPYEERLLSSGGRGELMGCNHSNPFSECYTVYQLPDLKLI